MNAGRSSASLILQVNYCGLQHTYVYRNIIDRVENMLKITGKGSVLDGWIFICCTPKQNLKHFKWQISSFGTIPWKDANMKLTINPE